MTTPTKTTVSDLVTRLIQICIREHGGFSHGNATTWCPECQTWLKTFWRLVDFQ